VLFFMRDKSVSINWWYKAVFK